MPDEDQLSLRQADQIRGDLYGLLLAEHTCASVLTLFVGALRDTTVASVLFTTFGLAVMCTIGAIGAFTAENADGW